MSHSKRNYYEILKATSSASFNELKANYKQLILQCHPDKLHQQLEMDVNNLQMNAKTDDTNNLEFVAITEAWNCLKDPTKRKQYDAEQLLSKFHTHNNIYAHLKLSEMKKQPNTAEYYEGAAEDEEQEVDVHISKGESTKDGVSKYIYTYECRCGGQYVVDESAEQYCCPANNHDTQIINSDNNGVQDDADNKTNNDTTSSTTTSSSSSSVQNEKNSNPNNAGGSSSVAAGGGEGVVLDNADGDEEGGGELIVECSECSLVIILNG